VIVFDASRYIRGTLGDATLAAVHL
jgi:hypothetical protein